MKCPKCRLEDLKEIEINDVKIDRCKYCGGLWFDKDELKVTRDSRDKNLSWLDFDLWEDGSKLMVSGRSVNCPKDGKPLFKIKYGNTDVMVDICLDCHGVWLDKNELDKIISELKEKINSETMPEYLSDLGKEITGLFAHPNKADVELQHIVIIMKMLEYRFLAQHPKIAEIISVLPD
ncbi:MAG: zf-TFIIB domain-containing protein [Candidatus Pacebacteria bacterium]|nr:zf-TFIIB domain-containing protein [Candidatus Paceibacterota bacterium]